MYRPPKDQIHVVSMSGGKDSTASALTAIDMGYEIVGVFADTGNEHEITYEYLDYLERKIGIKIHRVSSDFSQNIRNSIRSGKYNIQQIKSLNLVCTIKNQFLSLCAYKKIFPSRTAQFCTEYLKRIPVTIFQEELGALHKKPVCSWQGVRWQESEKRAKLSHSDFSDDWLEVYRPILHLKTKDVFDVHKRFGIKRNPLYDMGFNRVGCFPCVNCTKGELVLIEKLFPEHIKKVAKWERIMRVISKLDDPTFFSLHRKRHLISDHTIYGYLEYCKTEYKVGRPRKEKDFDFSGCALSQGVCE